MLVSSLLGNTHQDSLPNSPTNFKHFSSFCLEEIVDNFLVVSAYHMQNLVFGFHTYMYLHVVACKRARFLRPQPEINIDKYLGSVMKR